MARPLRIERAGGRYHATARGNERHDIFRDVAGSEQGQNSLFLVPTVSVLGVAAPSAAPSSRMARKLPVQYPGAIYHVLNRGDRREAIFLDDDDRRLFMDTLGEACEKTDWQIHAWCLMNNHFHLVVSFKNQLREKLLRFSKNLA